MKRARIKKVGEYWRVYRCAGVVAAGSGGVHIRWEDIGAEETWREALTIALYYLCLEEEATQVSA